jgi:ubiquinone/menaquinone biosynthesis C-methylase UbiE
MEDPEWTKDYVRRYRKIFVAIMGGIPIRRFTPDDEDSYIRHFMRPVGGPILDLACGPGRWTRTITDTVGAERTIGLDLSFAMLNLARKALPDSLLVRATALPLPFKSSSLGGVNCWNALQTLPEPARIITEVGRCLRPGGLFTCFTFRRGHGPYQLVQRAWEAIVKVRALDPDKLRQWLTAAELEIKDLQGPNLILLFTAEKRY